MSGLNLMKSWEIAQDNEAIWWGNCVNTYQEETKQREMFAPRLGLIDMNHEGRWPSYDLEGRSVVDIGGGPVSLLLKCFNYSRAFVVDPCHYPRWVVERYRSAGITFLRQPAEQPLYLTVDEIWIYNVLQHVVNPRHIIIESRKCCELIRMVEFVGVHTDDKHLHSLTSQQLDEWLGGTGTVEYIPAFNANVYHGSFPT